MFNNIKSSTYYSILFITILTHFTRYLTRLLIISHVIQFWKLLKDSQMYQKLYLTLLLIYYFSRDLTQFWKLLKDSQMYQKLAMPDADGVICKWNIFFKFIVFYIAHSRPHCLLLI